MKSAQISALLPEVFQAAVRDRGPLAALLGAMEQLHAHTEEQLAEIDALIDPARASPPFLEFLARWVLVAPDLTLSQEALRSTVASAVEIGRWRGTGGGLLGALEVHTGYTGFRLEEPEVGPAGTDRPFHLRVRAPAALSEYRRLLDGIIRREKPAYATYELEFENPADRSP